MTKNTLAFLSLLVSSTAISQINTENSGTGNSSINITDTTIYTTVDTSASFPGGKPAWFKFLQKNLNANTPVDNGARVGTYVVVIQFIVLKDGALKDFKAKTKYGHGMEAEVIRVLKLSPNWVPGKRNDVYVNSYAEQDMTFKISEG